MRRRIEIHPPNEDHACQRPNICSQTTRCWRSKPSCPVWRTEAERGADLPSPLPRRPYQVCLRPQRALLDEEALWREVAVWQELRVEVRQGLQGVAQDAVAPLRCEAQVAKASCSRRSLLRDGQHLPLRAIAKYRMQAVAVPVAQLAIQSHRHFVLDDHPPPGLILFLCRGIQRRADDVDTPRAPNKFFGAEVLGPATAPFPMLPSLAPLKVQVNLQPNRVSRRPGDRHGPRNLDARPLRLLLQRLLQRACGGSDVFAASGTGCVVEAPLHALRARPWRGREGAPQCRGGLRGREGRCQGQRFLWLPCGRCRRFLLRCNLSVRTGFRTRAAPRR
mmetsp:Transcript_10723/g.26776  ORF Transcript_10723/g.26776 Transcript_10723/m.26776 type:complete len:334 (+) Transcript_10723:318-1319(+)